MQTALAAVGLVGAAVLLTILGVVAVRRSVSLATLEAHNEVAGFVYAVVGVVYGVLLAFVVLAVWEEFERAEAHAEQEANALVDLYRLAGGLPEPARRPLREAVLTYTRAVVDEEWEAMAWGRPSGRALALVDDLWRAYLEIEPRTERERAVYSESLTRMSDFADARRLRLYESRNALPDVMWLALIIGAGVTVGFSLLFGVRSVASQAVMTATLAVSIVLLLFLTWALDHPFRGDVRVPPAAFEAALTAMEGAAPAAPGQADR